MLKKTLSDIQFWFHRRKYAEGRYYEIYDPSKDAEFDIDDFDKTVQFFKIIRGEFYGIVFHFTKLRFDEDGVKFGFRLIKGKITLRSTRLRLQEEIRKILLVILYRTMNGDDKLQIGLKPGEEYEDGNYYPEEPFNERTIRSKSSSLPEE